MTDKSNTEMLLPQAGIPGYIPQPKKNASEDVIGEYKKQEIKVLKKIRPGSRPN